MPDFPKKLSAASAAFTVNGTVVCGGQNGSEVWQTIGDAEMPRDGRYECYTITKYGTCKILEMKHSRSHFDLIVINNNWLWAFGEYGDVEVIGPIGHNPTPKPNNYNHAYPITGLQDYTFLSFNSTITILIGGEIYLGNQSSMSAKVYYYDHLSHQWKKSPSLTRGRHQHASGLVRDQVTKETFIIVSGGWIEEYDEYYGEVISVATNSTEMISIQNFFEDGSTWTKGVCFAIN